MVEKEPISHSEYSEEFSDVIAKEVFVLSESDSLRIWNTYIDDKGGSFFKLSDTNWIVRSNKVSIGRWLECFNNGNVKELQDLFNRSIDWWDNDTIFFCINRKSIIESSWYDFKRLWMQFLFCEDDAPIVINLTKKQFALIFTAQGEILQVVEQT